MRSTEDERIVYAPNVHVSRSRVVTIVLVSLQLTLCTKIFAVVYMYGVNYTCVTGTIGSIHLLRYVLSMFGRCNQCVLY